MIKKFKRKIIFLLMTVFVIFIFGILLSINLYYDYSNWTEVEKMLKLQVQERHIGGNPKDVPTNKGTKNEPAKEKMHGFRPSSIYSVRIETNGNLLPINMDKDSVYTEDEICEIAKEMLWEEKSSGFFDSFQYLITDTGKDSMIAFVDVSAFRKQQRQMIFYSVLIGIFCVFLSFEVSVVLSRWLVKPLEEAFDKQKQFIASASHELKTPLAIIKTSLDTMKNEGQGGKYLEYAMEENMRMSALVHEMLDLSDLEQVHTDIKFERIDMGKAVEGGCLPFEVMAYEKGVVLELEIDSEIYICANAEQLQHMVGILLDNAIRHTKQSGKVVVCLKNANGKAYLQVKNEGEPIPEAERDKIFESFYRLDKSRNRQEGRYGLGLAIAQGIAESFHGRIQVECQGGFTSFFVKFATVK